MLNIFSVGVGGVLAGSTGGDASLQAHPWLFRKAHGKAKNAPSRRDCNWTLLLGSCVGQEKKKSTVRR